MADITMPKMGFDMEEGTIVRWLKKPGDEIKKGEPIAEIETDKVTIEIEAFDSGKLTKIVADEGAVVPVGSTIAVLGGSGEATPAEPVGAAAPTQQALTGEEAPSAQEGAQGGAPEPRPGEGGEAASLAAQQTESAAGAQQQGEAQGARTQATAEVPRQGYGSDTVPEAEVKGGPSPTEPVAPGVGERIEPVGTSDGAHVKASPLAKRLARENNLDIAQISGSGPGGRIVKNDIEQALSAGARPAARPSTPQHAEMVPPLAVPTQPVPALQEASAPPSTPQTQPRPGSRREPLSRLRQTIARRMVQSKTQVPHFYVTVPIDMAAAMALRKELNAMEGVKISVNDMIVKGCALVLKQFPMLNASFAEDSLEYHDYINISIAVATDNGLLAPAVTDVDKKSLGVVASETRDLAERTRSGKATPDELSRGTFTVSNLGMFGKVESFIAIVNPPQSAIIAVGLAAETPIVKDGQVAIAPVLKATLSVDHRVGDGAIAAQFLEALRLLLESPMRLLI